MTIKPQLGFTYDCPHCFEPVSSSLDIFFLRTEKQTILCKCGRSELHAHIEDNVLLTEYPCALCGQRHEASFLPERALSGNMCCLECTQSGLPTGYISTPDKIEYLESYGSNDQICDFIMNLLGMKHSESKKYDSDDFQLAECKCGCRNFSASYSEPYLWITCQNCGAVTEIISNKLDINPEDKQ